MPTAPVCVTLLTAHMHERGTFFAVDFIDSDGQVKNGDPSPALENPYEPGCFHFFVSRKYSDPAEYTFDPPRLLVSGQRFHYACWHDNGVAVQEKLGCEEYPGGVPGSSIADAFIHGGSGPAYPCHTPGADPTECYLGTGNCVDANLVFGATSDDDMCILPGAYYDADMDAPPGHECDLDRLPPLS